MPEQNPSILSHVSIGTNRFEDAVAFYDKVLATIGCRRVMEHAEAVAYGRAYPEFWVQAPLDGSPATTGNGSHFGFFASSRNEVDEFFRVATASGGVADGRQGRDRSMANHIMGASSSIWTATKSRRPSGTLRVNRSR